MMDRVKQFIKGLTASQKWAIVIGTGLALFPIHNKWLTDITSIEGQATLFLPAIGGVIWILGTLFYVLKNWQELGWGDKKVYIPLLIISASIGISGFINGTAVLDRVAPLFMGAIFFTSYLASRKLGLSMFWILIPFVITGVAIAVVNGILNPGTPAGGMITNYCASAGFLIFGAITNRGKWQWILIMIALIGIFFIGALESVFILGVLAITVLIRRDFGRRFYLILAITLSTISLWAALGYLVPLYTANPNLATLHQIATRQIPIDSKAIESLTTGRWTIISRALSDIKIFGHGYFLGTVGGFNVHNTPLIIVHQTGILAALAWTFVTIYCVIKTRLKYAWIAIIAMSIFDHYIWTQFGAYWWVLAGVSSTTVLKNDHIFRKT